MINFKKVYLLALIGLNNLLVAKEERYVVPKKNHKYTFTLVGLGATASAVATNRNDAARKIYDRLSEYELEKLEWADLEKEEEV